MRDIARDLLVAFLHDPPDKALQIRGHEARARRYLHAALGDVVSEAELKDRSDPLAAIAERLPAPHWDKCLINFQETARKVRHPLSGEERELALDQWNESAVIDVIRSLTEGVDDTERRFLLLWRRLPEELAARCGSWFSLLPADTRIPDHTIWHHLDTTAAIKAAEDSRGGSAFLSFALGPVQPFIAAARSVRDLWSGSMILSWLTFHGMLPVIETLGPTAMVYPALRGLPWLDRWLRNKRGLQSIPDPDITRRLSPCLPNRFLALVPYGQDGRTAAELAEQCRQAAVEAWRKIADAVRRRLNQMLDGTDSDWARHWDAQIDDFFDIRMAVLPWDGCGDDRIAALIAPSGRFGDAFPAASAVRGLADAMPKEDRPGYEQKSAGRWQAKVDLSARLMQTLRAVRHVPGPTAVGEAEPVAAKCSMLGSREQMGPPGLDDSRKFWEAVAPRWSLNGVRLRDGERLSAVALVKRFCGPAFFADELEVRAEDLRFEDTATVAAAEWLEKPGREELKAHADGARSSQWLHWAGPAQGEDDGEDPVPADVWEHLVDERRREPVPAYYAVLTMDGDRMGEWLRGDQSPAVRDVMHRQLVDYFEKLRDATADGKSRQELVRAGLDANRPVGPALHAAISEALANFALYEVPRVVDQHHGMLIYAGGDDVLALLPTRTALDCARALNDAFRQPWADVPGSSRPRLLMGNRATVSAGLAVVHIKEDLRTALETARRAEKAAKSASRDALQIAVGRRSGEHASALCPWPLAETVCGWIDRFVAQASDRWAYHLRAELPTLRGLETGAIQAEIQRLIQRAEQATVDAFPPRAMAAAFAAYREELLSERRRPKQAGFHDKYRTPEEQNVVLTGRALDGFVTLCQSASFLARGRDA